MAAATKHPYKTAYLLLGHGEDGRKDEEGPKTCIVPPGCMVVVDAHAGEVTAKNREIEYFFNTPDKDKFLDPENNYFELVKNISSHGSLAIYKEGDRCPNFRYSLISYWDKENKKKVMLAPSGAVEYPFTGTQKYEIFSCDDSPNKILPFIYDPHRIIITEIYIKESIEEGKTLCDVVHGLANEKYVFNIYDKDFEKNGYDTYVLTQQNLFDDVKLGRSTPGVFYNLICRTTSAEILNNAKNTGEQLIKNSLKTLNLSRNAKTKKVKFLIPELLLRIGEAEKHRKPYMPGYIKSKYKERLTSSLEQIKTDLEMLNTKKRRIQRSIKRVVFGLSDSDKEILRKLNEQIEIRKGNIETIEKKIHSLNTNEINKKNNSTNTTRKTKRRKLGNE